MLHAFGDVIVRRNAATSPLRAVFFQPPPEGVDVGRASACGRSLVTGRAPFAVTCTCAPQGPGIDKRFNGYQTAVAVSLNPPPQQPAIGCSSLCRLIFPLLPLENPPLLALDLFLRRPSESQKKGPHTKKVPFIRPLCKREISIGR